ncbi:MarR family winged helix-turn-helix transcriptional regulator [Saccharicrinis fermentans]|uniref:Organic hydroperoxide resistance transcriptional regulator n=1 Tax=Saccharicrinis fermentans DSM 9555 = JCM 21142 TaxID=869213 RepID=W7YEG5_9BACT|nr:MarR family transcriptional regulator [Saccharicrinis fermentans]GAF05868.1 organic hydroperoxide resistance transcriptional regulator [Saccharicrinis fermentans DSM 9555 = JCM 21142]
MNYERLKLENQLCFPVYATSRLITREYQPYLDELGITYPQYLVLLVLWETDSISVNDIAKKLILKTNTLTPLLKRMEQLGLIHRTRSKNDERKVIVNLSSKGRELREKAVLIPEKLITRLSDGQLSIEKLIELKNSLTTIISFLSK